MGQGQNISFNACIEQGFLKVENMSIRIAEGTRQTMDKIAVCSHSPTKREMSFRGLGEPGIDIMGVAVGDEREGFLGLVRCKFINMESFLSQFDGLKITRGSFMTNNMNRIAYVIGGSSRMASFARREGRGNTIERGDRVVRTMSKCIIRVMCVITVSDIANEFIGINEFGEVFINGV